MTTDIERMTDEFQGEIDRLWERMKALEEIARRARGEYSDAKGEVHRLRDRLARAERQRDALAEAAWLAVEFLSEVVAYGLARQRKGEIGEALRAALDGLDPAPAGECSDGQPHRWGIDGQHGNEYCKRCFVSRPAGEGGGTNDE